MAHKNHIRGPDGKVQGSILRDSELELKPNSPWFEPCTSPTCANQSNQSKPEQDKASRRVPPPGSKDSLFRPAENAAPPRGPDGPAQGISKAIREGALSSEEPRTDATGIQPDRDFKDDQQ